MWAEGALLGILAAIVFYVLSFLLTKLTENQIVGHIFAVGYLGGSSALATFYLGTDFGLGFALGIGISVALFVGFLALLFEGLTMGFLGTGVDRREVLKALGLPIIGWLIVFLANHIKFV